METTEKRKISKTAVLKFVICSIIGILIFFVNFPINGKKQLPIDWLTSSLAEISAPYYVYICAVCSVFVIVGLIRNKFWKDAPFKIFLNILTIGAVVLIVMDLFGLMPSFFLDNGIYMSALNTLGKSFIMIFIVMFFLPLIIDYGLPEAVGVFARPVTRLLFGLPGKTAVVIVSSFLGNFTVGHMQTNEMYKRGEVTLKEAAILCTGFATSSIALIMAVCGVAGMMPKFTLIFIFLFIVTLTITAITAHIYPLCKYPNTNYEGITPDSENYEKGNMFKVAFQAGTGCCEKSGNVIKAMLNSGIRAFQVVANITISGIGCMIFFSVINQYTPVFKAIGIIFWPFLKLMGFAETNIIYPLMGMNAVDNVTAMFTLAGNPDISNMAKIFACGYGITVIIFFGAFLSSLFSTKIRIKVHHLILIWVERSILTVILWGLVARLLA